MTGRIGADIVQMTTLQSTFGSQATAVEEIRKVISARLLETQWEGPAAERFRTAWEGEFAPVLQKLVGALTEAGGEVANRMRAIQAAGS